tara:strand:- start:702 stop:878 length:177 start_codon:yes stop_codon:yes gene_type:complete
MKTLIFDITPTHAKICKRLGISIDDYAEQVKKHLTEELQGKSLEEILDEHPELDCEWT